MVSASGVRLDSPQVDGRDRYWLEGRPAEQGRVVLVRRSGATVSDVTPPPFSVRTRAHEYGGGAYLAAGGTVWFSNFEDQRLWRVSPGGAPVPLTGQPGEGVSSVRYADARLTLDGRWLVCVRETHRGPSSSDVVNEVVALHAGDGAGADEVVLATGRDFYSFPRVSPDGHRLAWTCWDHPLMPWDGAELWAAELVLGDAGLALGAPRRVAGGRAESIFQPEWGPDGHLWFVSDADGGWWNLWRHDLASVRSERITFTRGEWGRAQWAFGLSTYAFLADGSLVGTWTAGGVDHLGVLDPASSTLRPLNVGYSAISNVVAAADGVVLKGASATRGTEIVELGGIGSGARPPPVVLASAPDLGLDPAGISFPEPIELPTSDGLSAHALYYPPASATFCGPDGERPPLLVLSHGGPTSAARSAFQLSVQYWTSRGIAVVAVNYGGSTGYSRDYRERLKGAWGVLDVDDCVNAALYLVTRGDVDRERLAIRGGSAGGYTTLCALTFRDTFAVGASYYGVADAAVLAADTHKFEARYLDSLIGPWPEAAELYRARSPLFHSDQLACPVIVFQGADDPVVPPNQAESMVAALAERGLRHAYMCFEGEAHGFRAADTLRRCLLAELDFYGEVLGFEPAGARSGEHA